MSYKRIGFKVQGKRLVPMDLCFYFDKSQEIKGVEKLNEWTEQNKKEVKNKFFQTLMWHIRWGSRHPITLHYHSVHYAPLVTKRHFQRSGIGDTSNGFKHRYDLKLMKTGLSMGQIHQLIANVTSEMPMAYARMIKKMDKNKTQVDLVEDQHFLLS